MNKVAPLRHDRKLSDFRAVFFLINSCNTNQPRYSFDYLLNQLIFTRKLTGMVIIEDYRL